MKDYNAISNNLSANYLKAIRDKNKEMSQGKAVSIDSSGDVPVLRLVGDFGLMGDEGISQIAVNESLDSIQGDFDIHINSIGGITAEGLGIYHSLNFRANDIRDIYIMGVAYSAASFVAMAGNRLPIMPSSSVMMIHNSWVIAAGNAQEFRDIASRLEIIDSSVINIYSKSNNVLSRDEIKVLMEAETFMDSEIAIENGFARPFNESNEPLNKSNTNAFRKQMLKDWMKHKLGYKEI